MHHALRFVMAMVAIAAALGCAQPAPTSGSTGGTDKEQMIVAAKALDQRFVEAYNAGDVEAVMACYWHSPNLVYFPTGAMEAHGWEAVKNDFAQGFAAIPGGSLELTDSNYEVLGDAVVSWGTWRFTAPSESGEPTVIDGRYTDVMAPHDGTWLYMLDHVSVPMAAPRAGSGT